MAAPCVSCGRVLSLRLAHAIRAHHCQRPGYWTASAVGWQTGPRSQLLKLIHTTVITPKKHAQASRQESYTEDFIKKQIEEFNIGKRHLANMMGEDPETFTQEDIDDAVAYLDPHPKAHMEVRVCHLLDTSDITLQCQTVLHVIDQLRRVSHRAIAYLFPSGLFEKRARPVMKHPEQIFPKQRAIQWGEDGRPFHFLFYTGKQSYYSLMHDVYGKILQLEKRGGPLSENPESRDLIGSRWLIKEELEEMLVEKLSDQDANSYLYKLMMNARSHQVEKDSAHGDLHALCDFRAYLVHMQYVQFIRLLEKLLTLPCGPAEEEFMQRFRRSVAIQSKKQLIEPVQYDERGMAFSTSEGRRKSATAQAVVYEHGSGKIHVNGVDYLLYFPVTQDREQLMFPFHFLDRLEKHDVTCTVSGGGRSAQAGAIRLAMAKALCSFITEDEVEWMRQAGLLTPDPRIRERKKPGQEGARKKFTWKKR